MKKYTDRQAPARELRSTLAGASQAWRGLAAAVLLVALLASAGCKSNAFVSPEIKTITPKHYYVEAFSCKDPSMGELLRDTIRTELMREGLVALPSREQSSLIISGAAILTKQSDGGGESIESVSVTITNQDGSKILFSHSYANSDDLATNQVGQEFGGEIAEELSELEAANNAPKKSSGKSSRY